MPKRVSRDDPQFGPLYVQCIKAWKVTPGIRKEFLDNTGAFFSFIDSIVDREGFGAAYEELETMVNENVGTEASVS